MADPALVAAAPSLIAMLQAIKQFRADLGTNPVQIPLNLPGAEQKFLGTIWLQFPVLAQAETGVVGNLLDTQVDGLITKIQNAVKS